MTAENMRTPDGGQPFGLYLHVPFCASKCAYCDFYSFPDGEDRQDAYVAAMERTMAAYAGRLRGRTADTVYVGGGTPSWLGRERLVRLLSAVREHFSVTPDAEWTVECNPDSMDGSLLDGLRQAGVNRLSIGVQSADDGELRRLGRRHTFAQAAEAVGRGRTAGFKNLSLDLMYGLPGQTTEGFLRSVEAVLALAPEHLSCYGLKLEPGTPLYRENPVLPDGDAQADLYLALCGRLAKAGFQHYEISNWALPGRRSRHNSRYWTLSPYLGLGPGAHSLLDGVRFAYPRDLDAFCAGEEPVPEPPVEGFDARAEWIMLALRTAEGVSADGYTARFGRDFAPLGARLAALESHGLTARTDGGWRLTETGFLVSNLIIADVLSADESN